jgi:RNA polymerase sigma factor (sigma-70 family)
MCAHVADEEWVLETATTTPAAPTTPTAPAAAPPPAHPAPARTLFLSRLSDERLARLVAAGSRRAIGELYKRYHQPLYRYCRSILLNDPDAQDAVQSTFVSALSALQRSQRDAPLRPWLFRIAHNESISLVRRRRGSGEELAEEHAPPVASAAERAGERARLALLITDLVELPDRLRSALCMRELSGLSHEEIAIALNMSVGGAKQAIFEARRALAEFVEGRDMPCEEIRRKISDGDRRALRGRRVRAHLRDCRGCAAFAAAMPARRADLRALAPVLPPAASAALFGRTMTSLSGHGHAGAGAASAIGTGSGTAAGTGAATAGGWAVPAGIGAAGNALTATVASKAAIGAVVLATAAAGVGGVTAIVALDNTGHAGGPPRAQPVHPAATTASPPIVSRARAARHRLGAGAVHRHPHAAAKHHTEHGLARAQTAATVGIARSSAHSASARGTTFKRAVPVPRAHGAAATHAPVHVTPSHSHPAPPQRTATPQGRSHHPPGTPPPSARHNT